MYTRISAKKLGKVTVLADETFGQWLKRTREERGWSQRRLAKESGFSNNYLSNLEKDYSPSSKNQKPELPISTVDALAKALGVPVSEARDAAGYTQKSATPDPVRERALGIMDSLPEPTKQTALQILEALYRGEIVKGNVPEKESSKKRKRRA